MTEAEEKLKRLYNMVEDGMTDIHDSLKERLASHKRDREMAKVAVYIKSVVDQIEVDHGNVRLIEDKSTLEQAIAGIAVAAEGIRRSVLKWCATQNKTANTYVIEIAL